MGGLSCFSSGVILDVLRCCGYIWVSMIVLIRWQIGPTMCFLQAFICFMFMSSGPHELDGFELSISSISWFSVIFCSLNVDVVFLVLFFIYVIGFRFVLGIF